MKKCFSGLNLSKYDHEKKNALKKIMKDYILQESYSLFKEKKYLYFVVKMNIKVFML